MAKKSRATFQKREKERARQQKQQDKVQKRLAAKEMRTSNPTSLEDGEFNLEDDELTSTGLHVEQHVPAEPWDDAPHPAD
jgi:hypothetical protein